LSAARARTTSRGTAGWLSLLRRLNARVPRKGTFVRYRLARRYLAGSGLEIGALHLPLWVPERAAVRYVDWLEADGLREHYPELASYDLVAPDLIDDGQRLALVDDASVDFVIANHVVEHFEDPISALETYARVLRPGGVLYMAVPDMRVTFDRDRPLTEVRHIVSDRLDGPAGSRQAHFQEWARLVDHVPDPEVETRAAALDERNYSIHFHTFVPANFVELISESKRRFGLELAVEEVVRHGNEFIVVMRKPHRGENVVVPDH
jgi:SAM-dependent methyltransferase